MFVVQVYLIDFCWLQKYIIDSKDQPNSLLISRWFIATEYSEERTRTNTKPKPAKCFFTRYVCCDCVLCVSHSQLQLSPCGVGFQCMCNPLHSSSPILLNCFEVSCKLEWLCVVFFTLKSNWVNVVIVQLSPWWKRRKISPLAFCSFPALFFIFFACRKKDSSLQNHLNTFQTTVNNGSKFSQKMPSQTGRVCLCLVLRIKKCNKYGVGCGKEKRDWVKYLCHLQGLRC